ncbi:MAG: 50S ribosomal protein L29 [bacterium]|nr:50S ribosomal protein L29 [bacterium]
MKFSELKLKSREELQKLLKEQREKERELRFKIASDQQKNVREYRSMRKSIAQTMTALRQAPKKKELVKS